jgi:hypothetical protein
MSTDEERYSGLSKLERDCMQSFDLVDWKDLKEKTQNEALQLGEQTFEQWNSTSIINLLAYVQWLYNRHPNDNKLEPSVLVLFKALKFLGMETNVIL